MTNVGKTFEAALALNDCYWSRTANLAPLVSNVRLSNFAA